MNNLKITYTEVTKEKTYLQMLIKNLQTNINKKIKFRVALNSHALKKIDIIAFKCNNLLINKQIIYGQRHINIRH